jgi:hypothetical protein
MRGERLERLDVRRVLQAIRVDDRPAAVGEGGVGRGAYAELVECLIARRPVDERRTAVRAASFVF